jgi:PAS domain S-box-containing protein/diguanylate cyclase (GGDEF)-like protein
MDLQRDNCSRNYYKSLIRTVSTIVIFAFLAKDLAWANPDLGIPSQDEVTSSNIQIETLFSDPSQQHRLTADLIQEAIESSVRNEEDLSVTRIEEVLSSLDKWNGRYQRKYEWRVERNDVGYPVEILITFSDNLNREYLKLRYYVQHPDAIFEGTMPAAWEGAQVHEVNVRLSKQVILVEPGNAEKTTDPDGKPARKTKVGKKTASDIYRAESAYKDYFETVFSLNLDLFRNMAERRTIRLAKSEDLLEVAPVLNEATEIIRLMGEAVEKFESRLQDFSEDMSVKRTNEYVKAQLPKFKELLSQRNEPAACAVLVGMLNRISAEKERVLSKKIGFLYGGRIKVYKENKDENKSIIIEQGRYYKPDDMSESSVKAKSINKFDRRWIAGRALDEMEDGILAEKEWAADSLKRLEDSMNSGDLSSLGPVARNVRQVLSGLGEVSVEEKRLAKTVLETVVDLIEIGQTDDIRHLLPIAGRYLSIRHENTGRMLDYVMNKRIRPFRSIVRSENAEFARRVEGIRREFEGGRYHDARQSAYRLLSRMAFRLGARKRSERDKEKLTALGLLSAYEGKLDSSKLLYIKEFCEPDLKGAHSLISAIAGKMERLEMLSSRKEENARIDISKTRQSAEHWLSILEEKIRDSELLSEFTAQFRAEYVRRRLEGEKAFVKEETFMDTFAAFSAKNNMDKGTPREAAFKILCYTAVFIPLEIKIPGRPGRRINPVIEAVELLQLMVRVDDITRIAEISDIAALKRTTRFFDHMSSFKKTVSGFTQQEKTDLLKAMARDLKLKEEHRFELAKAFSITRSNIRKTYPGRDINKAPLAFIDWVHGWFIDRGLISEETAAKFSFLIEEGVFSWALLSFVPWVLVATGSSAVVNMWVLYPLSIFLFSVSHHELYRWYRTNMVRVESGGEQYLSQGFRLKRGTRSDVVNYLGFAFLGGIFRAAYLVPGVDPLVSLATAMILHAVYNSVIAPKLSFPVAMAAGGTKKIVTFLRTFPITLRALYFTSILAGLSVALVLSHIHSSNTMAVFALMAAVTGIFSLARAVEAWRLNRYSDPGTVSNILHSVADRGDSPQERSKEEREVKALFSKILKIYKSYFVRDLVKKRKKLLIESVLPNIKPQGDPTASLGSSLRSDVVVSLLLEDVLASNDPTIYQPALESMIEVLAKEKRRHGDFFFNRYFPILKKSQNLPRFARGLIDELIKAEHGKIKLFYIENEQEFFDEIKEIIKRLADVSPELKKDIMEYLFEIAHKSKEEIPLVRAFLDDVRFHVVNSEEFPRISAGMVATEINRLKRELGRPVNVVLAGGKTMSGFLDELAEMPGIDWAMVNIFQVAEFKGLGPEDEASIASYIDRKLVKKISIPEKNIYFIGKNPDVTGYVETLRAKGDADIFVLGIGGNGQVAYNEPNVILGRGVSGLEEAQLSDETIIAKREFYKDIEREPRVYTMAMADILATGAHVFLFATGEGKSEIVSKAFFGPVTFDIPVSIFQQYREKVTVVFDKGAIGHAGRDILNKYTRALRDQRESEAMYRELFDEAPIGYHVLDRNGVIIRVNAKEAEMLGYTIDDMIGRPIFDFIPPDEREEAVRNFEKKISVPVKLKGFERKYHRKDGEVIWVRIEDRHVVDRHGNVIGMRSTLQNITELKEMQERLQEQALTDPLTGAYNRRYMEEEFPKFLEPFSRTGSPLSVLMVSIKGVRAVNERYGHAEGDGVLRRTMALLRDSAKRRGDIIVRYGNRDFLMVLPNSGVVSSQRDAVTNILNNKNAIGPAEANLELSIGIAQMSEDEAFQSLVDRAYMAMEDARALDGSGIVIDKPDKPVIKNPRAGYVIPGMFLALTFVIAAGAGIVRAFEIGLGETHEIVPLLGTLSVFMGMAGIWGGDETDDEEDVCGDYGEPEKERVIENAIDEVGDDIQSLEEDLKWAPAAGELARLSLVYKHFPVTLRKLRGRIRKLKKDVTIYFSDEIGIQKNYTETLDAFEDDLNELELVAAGESKKIERYSRPFRAFEGILDGLREYEKEQESADAITIKTRVAGIVEEKIQKMLDNLMAEDNVDILRSQFRDIRISYMKALVAYPRSSFGDYYNFGWLSKLSIGIRSLTERIAGMSKKDGSSRIVEALLIASVSGLLMSVIIPIVFGSGISLEFDLRSMFLVYGGFVAGVVTIWIMQWVDRFREERALEKEMSRPIPGVDTLLILDDRMSHRKAVREVYSHCSLIEEADSLEEARRIVEENPRFDLVVSDLCLYGNSIGSFRKVDFNGGKVQLRKGGEAFVSWLKGHDKEPGRIILHSTVFNRWSFDSILNVLTAYSPGGIRARLEKQGISVRPKSPIIKPHPHTAKTLFMWAGILSVVFGLDIFVFYKYLNFRTVWAGAGIFGTLVSGVLAKALMAVNKGKFPGQEEKEPQKEVEERVVPEQVKNDDVNTGELKPEPVENVYKRRSKAEEISDIKKETLEAMAILEQVSGGRVSEIEKLENMGYNAFVFFAGKGPSGKSLEEDLNRLTKDAGFDTHSSDEILQLAAMVTERFKSEDSGRLEVFMFRKIETASRTGIELVVREYNGDHEDLELIRGDVFEDVMIEGAGQGNEVKTGVRVVARGYVSPITQREVSDFISQMERSGLKTIEIYDYDGKKAFDMELAEFGRKALSRSGIIPRREEGVLRWFNDTSSGGIMLFDTVTGGGADHGEILDPEVTDRLEYLLSSGMISDIREEMKAYGFMVFVDSGVSGSRVSMADSIGSAVRNFALLIGFNDKEADEISEFARLESQREKEAGMDFPAILMFREITDGKRKGIEIVARESGVNVGNIDMPKMSEFDSFVVDSLDERRFSFHGQVRHEEAESLVDGTRLVARMFIPYETKMNSSSRISVPEDIKQKYGNRLLILRPHSEGMVAVWSAEVMSQKVRNLKIKFADKEGIAALRSIASVCEYARIDAQGRMRLHPRFQKRLIEKGLWKEIPVGFRLKQQADHFRLFPVYEKKNEGDDGSFSSPADQKHIVKNAGEVVLLLKNALEIFAKRVEEKGEEAFLVLDIPDDQCARIRGFIEGNVVRPLEQLSSSDKDLSRKMKGLRVVSGRKMDFVRKKVKEGTLDPENVVVITSRGRIEALGELKESFVTALDPSLLGVPEGFDPEAYYYPYLESALFALMRALGAYDYDILPEENRAEYRALLWRWYSRIPNVEKLEKQDFLERCFDVGAGYQVKKTVILKLIIPDAVKVDPKEIYRAIKEFITRA